MKNNKVEGILGALDSAAQAANNQAYIFIDAINESPHQEQWRNYLCGFLQSVRKFQNICIALTCRSVYEQRIVPDNIFNDSNLPRVRHYGFSGLEEKAIEAYFDKRGIDQSHTPFFTEFSNPLFLKICSDAMIRRGSGKLPKRVNGFSSVLLFYTDSLDDVIKRKLDLNRRNKVTLRVLSEISKIMIDLKQEQVPRDAVEQVLDSVLPGKSTQLIDLLIYEGALIDNVRYNDDNPLDEGIDCISFAYQRFCDYYRASELLDRYFDVDLPEESFCEGTVLYEIFKYPDIHYNLGIVEMMSIQVPERCKRELIALIPESVDVNRQIYDIFLESIRWRDPKCIYKETKEMLSEADGDEQFIATILKVSTDPLNCFNANYIHERLCEWTISERDLRWSVPLIHIYDGVIEMDDSISPIIDWVWNVKSRDIDRERVLLYATVLVWFFTTTHREMRDCATKALARLLMGRLQIATDLLKKFQLVDDLSLQERLYAAVYGAVLNTSEKRGLKELTKTTYELIFQDEEPPCHIFLRDYARGVIEFAYHSNVKPDGVVMANVRPPYKSYWSGRFPSEKSMKKYKKGWDQIYGSTHDSDFNWYTLDVVSNWTVTPLSEERLRTTKDDFRKFKKWVNMKGGDLVNELLEELLTCVEQEKITDDIEEKVDQIENKLRCELPPYWAQFFTRKVLRYTRSLMNPYSVDDVIVEFDKSDAANWICKRAHDIGWSKKRFEIIDEELGCYESSRDRPKVERVGKKYQYIALYELLARMSDNLHMKPDSYSPGMAVYDGPWDLREREIDPSLFHRETLTEKWAENKNETWWSPVKLQLGKTSESEREFWLWSECDIPPIKKQLIVKGHDKTCEWLVLDGFWKAHELSSKPNESHNREVWCRIRSVLIRKCDVEKLCRFLEHKKDLRSPHMIEYIDFYTEVFWREYPWHSSANMLLGDWDEASEMFSRRGLPVEHSITTMEHSIEFGTRDLSITKPVDIPLPSPYLMNGLNLKFAEHNELHLVDKDNQKAFFDPSHLEGGQSVALIRHDLLEGFLKENGLVLFWTIAGEKNVYHPKFYGRQCYSGYCHWSGGPVEGKTWMFKNIVADTIQDVVDIDLL